MTNPVRPARGLGAGLEGMLTAQDLEELLQIDAKTIYRYVRQGLIPYVRIQSRVRFVRSQIQEWVRSRSFVPEAPRGLGGR